MPGTTLDSVIDVQLRDTLGIPSTLVPPDVDLALEDAPARLLVAPYLNPSFIPQYLTAGYNSTVAKNYRAFVEAGGVLLALAGLNTNVQPRDQSCSAAFALIRAVLGAERLTGCECQPLPGGNKGAVAKFNMSAAASVLDAMNSQGVSNAGAAAELVAKQGQDFGLSMDTVGALPIVCSGAPAHDVYDLLQMYRVAEPQPPASDRFFLRLPGVNSTAVVPPGYRLASCDVVSLVQSVPYVMRLLSLLDVCTIAGGFVVGPRTGFDAVPDYRVVCTDDPNAQKPAGFECVLVTKIFDPLDPFKTTTLHPPPPPPPSPGTGDYEDAIDATLGSGFSDNDTGPFSASRRLAEGGASGLQERGRRVAGDVEEVRRGDSASAAVSMVLNTELMPRRLVSCPNGGGAARSFGNYAYMRPAYSSSLQQVQQQPGGEACAGQAAAATDGDRGTDSSSGPGTCMATAEGGSFQPWWSVDLGGFKAVGKVVVYLSNVTHPVSDLEVRAGLMPIVGTFGSPAMNPRCIASAQGVLLQPGRHEFVCEAALSGSYVSVQVLRGNEDAVLGLCEVEVYASPDAIETNNDKAPPPSPAVHFPSPALLHLPSPPPPPPGPPPTGTFVAIHSQERLPYGYRSLVCAEAQRFAGKGVLRVVPTGALCSVLGGVVSTTAVMCGDEAKGRVAGECRLVTNLKTVPEFPLPNTALLKAWRQGKGWVIFAGAGIVPEDNVFYHLDTFDDKRIWQQILLAISKVN